MQPRRRAGIALLAAAKKASISKTQHKTAAVKHANFFACLEAWEKLELFPRAKETTVGTILAIDDNALALAVRKKLLEHAGYRVLATTEVSEGLLLFATQPVDLVLMDYYLPGGGGRLCEGMKKAKPSVPIVILSGATELPDDLSHVDLFLSKLEKPESILRKLADVLFPEDGRMAA